MANDEQREFDREVERYWSSVERDEKRRESNAAEVEERGKLDRWYPSSAHIIGPGVHKAVTQYDPYES